MSGKEQQTTRRRNHGMLKRDVFNISMDQGTQKVQTDGNDTSSNMDQNHAIKQQQPTEFINYGKEGYPTTHKYKRSIARERNHQNNPQEK